MVSFASRSLSKSERNYSAHKLEFLALKWAVTDKFSDYLIGTHFTVITDNNPLTYILTSAKLDATGQRWVSALGQYNFDMIYRQGIKNQDADGMSRYPHEKLQDSDENRVRIEDSTVKAICSVINIPPYIEVIPAAGINIVEATESPTQPMAQIEMREIRKQQRDDRIIGKWVRAVIDKKMPDRNIYMSREDLNMKKNFNNFKMKRGLLFRQVKEGQEETVYQLVLPACYRESVRRGLHNDIGLPGRERTLSLLRERYFWAGMTVDV